MRDSTFSGVEFLKKEQFKLYRKTIEPELRISNIDIVELIKDLGWRRVHSPYKDEMKEIIIVLTCKQIECTSDADVESLIAEIDSTYIFYLIMHKNFPFEKAPVWLTYQLNLFGKDETRIRQIMDDSGER